MLHYYGMPVTVSESAMVPRWKYPTDPFIEYDPGDERWCRYFGFGRQVSEPGAYQIGNRLLVHPVVWNQIKKETTK